MDIDLRSYFDQLIIDYCKFRRDQAKSQKINIAKLPSIESRFFLNEDDPPETVDFLESNFFKDHEFITLFLDRLNPDFFPLHKLPLEVRKKNSFKNLAHKHEFFEMSFVYTGTCYCKIGDIEQKLAEGNILLYNTQAEHSIVVADESTNLLNILVRKSTFESVLLPMLKSNDLFLNFFLDSIYQTDEQPAYMHFHVDGNSRLLSKFAELLEEYLTNDLYAQSNMLFIFCSILVELSRQYRKVVDTQVYSSRSIKIEKIITYISDHCATVKLSDIADKFNYSSSHISRLITKSTGKSFTKLVSEFKLQKASDLIKNTDFSIDKIAQLIGYADRGSFEKLFKNFYGFTPARYRINHRKIAGIFE